MLIKKYDDDKSGNLNAQELSKCIQVYSDSRRWTTDPVKPTDEEISLLLKAAGHHKQNSVDASEIEYALNLWHSYVTNRGKIQSIFEKYDTDHSEKLEFDKLVLYLTDLNEGHRPKVNCHLPTTLSIPCDFWLLCLITNR
jgi:Ca2+-binding EF-hand superfamily protein